MTAAASRTPYRRHGGDKRGSAASRRARKAWMLATWTRCVHCGRPLTWDTVEADRITPGGSYRRENIQASCGPCNRDRSDNPAWISPIRRTELNGAAS